MTSVAGLRFLATYPREMRALGPVGLEPTIVRLKGGSLSRLATTPNYVSRFRYLRFIFSPFAAAIIGQTPESGTDVSSKAARLPSPVPPGLGLGGRNPIE